jgi:hypothetical protein
VRVRLRGPEGARPVRPGVRQAAAAGVAAPAISRRGSAGGRRDRAELHKSIEDFSAAWKAADIETKDLELSDVKRRLAEAKLRRDRARRAVLNAPPPVTR